MNAHNFIKRDLFGANNDMIRPSVQLHNLLMLALKKAGTKAELAKILGKSKNLVSGWYRGVEPRFTSIEALEDYVWGPR